MTLLFFSARAQDVQDDLPTAQPTDALPSSQDNAGLPAPLPLIDPDEPPPPAPELEVIPPRSSWNAGISLGAGTLPQFATGRPWMSLGAVGGWGRHFGVQAHRVGAEFAFDMLGPIGVQWSNSLSPRVFWDWVTPFHMYIGAALGPTLIIDTEWSNGVGIDTTLRPGGDLALRLGWGERPSLGARRLHVAIEPRLRIVGFGLDGGTDVAFIGAITIQGGKAR